jgi:hypothetical protein
MRARGKICVLGPPYIYFFLFEGLIFGSFHALASISFFFIFHFPLPLKYFLQGISGLTADI